LTPETATSRQLRCEAFTAKAKAMKTVLRIKMTAVKDLPSKVILDSVYDETDDRRQSHQ